MARGYRVPGPLIRSHDRLFHETVNATRPGMTVVDIGANCGEVASAFAARGATVHAFEPNPDIYVRLEDAARRYPGIHPQMCAVFDRDTEMKLYLHSDYADDPAEYSESSSLMEGKDNLSRDDYRMVPVRDVAGIITEIGSDIDIMKIDVEGAEYAILDRLLDSGAIESVGMVFVEPHVGRVPGLAEEHERILARIAEMGLGARFRFDWA